MFKKKLNNFCLCGCKKEIPFKPFHKYYGTPKYIWGHNRKNIFKVNLSKEILYQEYIVKQKSTTQIAKEFGIDHKTIIYRLKRYNIPRREKGKAFLGKKLSKEHRENISKGNMGRIFSEETIEKIRKANLEHNVSKKTREKQSKTWKSKYQEGYEHPLLNKSRSESTKKKLSKSLIKVWEDEEYREKQIKAILKGLCKRPTSFEGKIIKLIKKHNLSFNYCGNGQVLICFRNPDFIENDGRKLLIETYYSFWHPKNYEEVRANIFAKFGYKTLFLNENDLLCKN